MSMTAPGRQIFNRWCQSLGILPPLSSHGFARTSSSHTNNLNAGTATATAAYADSANHLGSSDSATFVIDKANAIVLVTGYTGNYDGAAHGATGSATGVLGETLSGLDLGASFTNVPGGTATWTFTDTTGNYNNAKIGRASCRERV